jgi:3-oxoacyl-[acyl-carrier protein] reductase
MLVHDNFVGIGKFKGSLLVLKQTFEKLMQTLNNKIALVTGGSRGIGAAIVRRLAADGATVIFTYVNGKEKAEHLVNTLREQGYNTETIKADSGAEGEVTSVITKIIERYGRLDILVNSAGVFAGKGVKLAEQTLADFDYLFAVNVRGVTEACLAASRLMSSNGRIINIGSSLATRVPSSGATLYAASKSALIGLTKGLARDLGPKGITVNLVHPGSTNTEMNPENNPSSDSQRGRMAIPKFGQPEHIAAMVAYLAREEAGFATGAEFTIDGGANC